MNKLRLVFGNANYSSWSLRPWLALKQAGLDFEEIQIPLFDPDWAAELASYTPTGKVPVLHHGDRVIWDSLAILEYVAELAPGAGLWPAEAAARAEARAVSAEMHSGFETMRGMLPVNLRKNLAGKVPLEPAAKDIERVTEIWRGCRGRHGGNGPFLFGAFSNADAMFSPVVTRFATYGVELDAACQAYLEAMMALPALQEWYGKAAREPWVIEKYELG